MGGMARMLGISVVQYLWQAGHRAVLIGVVSFLFLEGLKTVETFSVMLNILAGGLCHGVLVSILYWRFVLTDPLTRYLNTREKTAIGRGLGLETGNTIYFDMAPGEFSYWNTSDAGRAAIHALIRSGHIDCFHSFGDLASTRADVNHALAALDQTERSA